MVPSASLLCTQQLGSDMEGALTFNFKSLSVSQKPEETLILFLLPHSGDFRGWRALKQQPCKLTDNLKVRQGLVPVGASREGLPVQEPFQSITSYRSHYIRHPLQNRTRSRAPVYRHHFNDFMQHFKTWSLGTKIHSQTGPKKFCKAAAMCTDLKPVPSSLSTSDQKHNSLQTTVRGNLRSPKLIPNAPQAPTR